MKLTQKLYLKALWLKKMYPYRWAHKPLCHSHTENMYRLGEVHVCRSCTLAYLGIFLGLLYPFIFSDVYQAYGTWLLVGLMAVTLPGSSPLLYKRLPRRVRDGLRFSMGLIVSQVALLLILGNWLVGLGVFVLCYGVWKWYYTQRAQRRLEACKHCPEYGQGGVCSGFAKQVQAARAYETEATAYIVKSGFIPNNKS